MKKGWVKDPHSGGVKIPDTLKLGITKRILACAEEHYTGKYSKINVGFKAAFCYIDAYKDPYVPEHYDSSITGESRDEYILRLKNFPFHLCRLRYQGGEEWTVAYYSYSNNKYEPSIFDNGSFYGTPEEALLTFAMCLED